ncbi:NAD(P)-binding protein [Phlegmacium glaucopus]|nr:NAD(P)-binding protein [Phlegmacium glaucopus]
MSFIPDDRLFSYSERVKGKVVVITGAANGIGKETALRFASYGAKVVIGDLDITGANKVVAEVEKAGGTAIAIKCNVTDWDAQVEMFELAIKKYGSVDIVVPNAGISEASPFGTVKFENDRPVKPSLITLEVNLVAVMYTAHLALHYLDVNKQTGELKSLIFIGSMASWSAIPNGVLYSASKHAVLGMMRSIYPSMEQKGIRVGCIHPFFADTGIVPIPVKLVLAGIPKTPVSRVAGAIFYAATDTDEKSNGSAWLLVDDGPVFMVPKEEFKQGVYQMIDDRANAGRALRGVAAWYLFARDVWGITGNAIITVGLGVALAKVAWDNKHEIDKYIHMIVASWS